MDKVQNIGLLGGSFDPVHLGHLILAEEALKQFKLNKVIFIPAKQPPHKLNKRLTNINKRVDMLSLAIKPYENFELDLFEINKKTTTYTFQTVNYFKNLYPKSKIFFIIGSDSLVELKTWKNINDLFLNCTFIVGKRKGIVIDKNIPALKYAKILKRPIPDISSTTIRKMIVSGKSLKDMLSPEVEKYITETQLYKHYEYR